VRLGLRLHYFTMQIVVGTQRVRMYSKTKQPTVTIRFNNMKKKTKAEFTDMCINLAKDTDPENRVTDNDWLRALRKLIPYQKLIKQQNIQTKERN